MGPREEAPQTTTATAASRKRLTLVSNLVSCAVSAVVVAAYTLSEQGAASSIVQHRSLQECCVCFSDLPCAWPELRGCGPEASFNGAGLSGSIPGSIGDAKQLVSLDISFNDLGGSIPSEIGLLTELTSLKVRWNQQVEGPIPTEIGRLTGLTELWFDGNQLTGAVPNQLNRLTSLNKLELASNNIGGQIPICIFDLFPSYDCGEVLCPCGDNCNGFGSSGTGPC